MTRSPNKTCSHLCENDSALSLPLPFPPLPLPTSHALPNKTWSLLSFYGCGTDRPCELLQRRCAPVVPTAVYTSLASLCHTVMAVARAPPVFLYAMIHQHRCCASVTHRAPKPRLAQLRPRSPVCALTGLAVCPVKFDLLTPFPPGLPVREAFLSEP